MCDSSATGFLPVMFQSCFSLWYQSRRSSRELVLNLLSHPVANDYSVGYKVTLVCYFLSHFLRSRMMSPEPHPAARARLQCAWWVCQIPVLHRRTERVKQ